MRRHSHTSKCITNTFNVNTPGDKPRPRDICDSGVVWPRRWSGLTDGGWGDKFSLRVWRVARILTCSSSRICRCANNGIRSYGQYDHTNGTWRRLQHKYNKTVTSFKNYKTSLLTATLPIAHVFTNMNHTLVTFQISITTRWRHFPKPHAALMVAISVDAMVSSYTWTVHQYRGANNLCIKFVTCDVNVEKCTLVCPNSIYKTFN